MHTQTLADSAFSLQLAAQLAQACETVYAAPDVVAQWAIDEWDCDEFMFFDVEDSQGFVAADGQSLIVAFRGTQPSELSDWLTDADTTLVPGPLDGKVHGGFYDALADIWQSLDREVRRIDPTGRLPLWITGHSLGGALATLAAARWIERQRRVDGVYTFGQPRVGDRTFSRNYNFALKASSFRFVNNNDMVTRIPPRALGYFHVGTLKYFTDEGNLEEDFSWWQQFLDQWKFRLEDFLDGALEGVADHSMLEYRQRVEAALLAAGAHILPMRLQDADDVAAPPPALRLIQPRRRAA
jgi:triacylglycerol lipase